MEERLQELLDTALVERFGLAFLAMKEECSADAAALNRLVALSEQLEHHPGISEEGKATVQEFLSLDADNNARFQKYLYIQGAKDCVAMLRELDLIKYASGGG